MSSNYSGQPPIQTDAPLRHRPSLCVMCTVEEAVRGDVCCAQCGAAADADDIALEADLDAWEAKRDALVKPAKKRKVSDYTPGRG